MVILVEDHLPHFLVGLSARAHVAAIRQDIAEALARVVRRVALEQGVPSASIKESRGDSRCRIICCPRSFRRAWSSLRVIFQGNDLASVTYFVSVPDAELLPMTNVRDDRRRVMSDRVR